MRDAGARRRPTTPHDARLIQTLHDTRRFQSQSDRCSMSLRNYKKKKNFHDFQRRDASPFGGDGALFTRHGGTQIKRRVSIQRRPTRPPARTHALFVRYTNRRHATHYYLINGTLAGALPGGDATPSAGRERRRSSMATMKKS